MLGQNSKVYGYDIAKIQPCLENMDKFKSLARRIQWVHGNLCVHILNNRFLILTLITVVTQLGWITLSIKPL